MNFNNLMGNMGQLKQQFEDFKQQYTGDAEKDVKELLQSGKMSQGEFQTLSFMAKMFLGQG